MTTLMIAFTAAKVIAFLGYQAAEWKLGKTKYGSLWGFFFAQVPGVLQIVGLKPTDLNNPGDKK